MTTREHTCVRRHTLTDFFLLLEDNLLVFLVKKLLGLKLQRREFNQSIDCPDGRGCTLQLVVFQQTIECDRRPLLFEFSLFLDEPSDYNIIHCNFLNILFTVSSIIVSFVSAF